MSNVQLNNGLDRWSWRASSAFTFTWSITCTVCLASQIPRPLVNILETWTGACCNPNGAVSCRSLGEIHLL